MARLVTVYSVFRMQFPKDSVVSEKYRGRKVDVVFNGDYFSVENERLTGPEEGFAATHLERTVEMGLFSAGDYLSQKPSASI